MSLVGVFSSLTVEPNNPSWHTPTARRGAFSVERILMTVLFSIYFVFVVPHGRLLACGQFRGAWPAANGWGGLRPEIWENLFRKSENIVIV